MPSKNRIVAYLDKEDKKLFDRAIKLYNTKESKLLKEIVHAWT